MLKAKQCKQEGCEFAAWSKGLCKAHMDAKPKKLKSSITRKKRGSEMNELFDRHWSTHPDRKCEVCGKQLYGENLKTYHDHLLDKSIYPELALEIENLCLVCQDCHACKSIGHPKPKHQELIELAKLKFIEND